MTDYLAHTLSVDDPRLASAIDEVSLWSARFGVLLLDHLELAGGIDGLDVACGTGFPLFELAHRHGPSCRFTGVDIWQEALDRARQKRAVYALDTVRLVHADASHLPFPDASFDLITSNVGINNVDDPHAVLAECARVARSQARLVLTTNVEGHMHAFYETYRQVLQASDKPEYLERLAVHEAHRGTQASHCALVEEAGFRVIRVVEDRFQLRFLDGSALLRHALVRIGFLEAWRAVVDKHDEEAVFTRLEERLNDQAQQTGGLAMTVPMLYLEARRI